MSNLVRVDWVMERHLQNAFDEVADLVTDGLVTHEEVVGRLKWGLGSDIADWWAEWWDGADMDE